MKTNIMKPFAIYILLLGFSLFLDPTLDNSFFFPNLFMPMTIACEGFSPSDLNNSYWSIEEIKADLWHVLFHNVNIKYELLRTPSDTDAGKFHFEFREIGPNYTGVHNDKSLLKLTTAELLDYWHKNNQGFEYMKNGNGALSLLGSADKSNVFHIAYHHNVVDASMHHFNDIQRGNFHANLPNLINPNSHGRTDVLSYVPNNFGIHEDWPVQTSQNNLSRQGSIGPGMRTSSGNDHPGTNIKRDIRSPLDQFLIIDLFMIIIPLLSSLYLSFTNIILYLIISTLILINMYILPTYSVNILLTKWYTTIKSIYETVYNLVKSQIQSLKGINLLPFFFCLFIYILTNNLVGMVPYSFAPTSHFILTFFISFTIVLGCTILGFILHRLIFFSLLTPSGCPLGLLPLLVLIETVSYLARNVSLGLRLAANILSGHMLLNILSEFTYKIMDTNTIYFFIGVIPVTFIGGFSALELGIAFIQSQVFVVLSSSYSKDSIELH